MKEFVMNEHLDTARALYASLLQKPQPSYQRSLLEKVSSSTSRMLGIYGARGVGKTTLMLQWLKQQQHSLSETLYLSCDHPALKGINFFELIAFFERQGGKVVVLDEVHELPDFEQTLKSIYDFLNIRVIFSGSSAIALTHPDLSRRYAMFHLMPLSLREYIALAEGIHLPLLNLDSILADPFGCSLNVVRQLNERKILPLFKRYLEHGGYPFYFEDPLSFQQKLADTINLIVQFELASLFLIQPDKTDLLKKMLTIIGRSKPMELSPEKFTSNIELSKPTFYKYLDYLVRGELVRIIPHELKKLKNLRKADKIYLAHPNLLSVLALPADIGSLREVFFAAQLEAANHLVEFSQVGDFLIDGQIIFEVGGSGKDFSQLKEAKRPAFLALDDIESGSSNKIPLWLFGFLY